MAGVFKAYDVRGLYPQQIDERLVRRIANRFAGLLGQGPVVLGRDMRTSSPLLLEAAAEGLLAAGRDVIDLGMVSTPVTYFATARRAAAGGIMVTASHNPAGYNGLKFCREQAIPVGYDTGLARIERALAEGAPELEGPARGTRTLEDIVPEVAAFLRAEAAPLIERRRGEPPYRIAIDTGNGVVGPLVARLTAGWPIEVVPLYFEPDGTFPHHEANPLKVENLRDLMAAVREHRCALGLAFDGDGDRVALVDERGAPVAGDVLTALIARAVLRRTGPATVLYDLRSSRVVREEVQRLGGRAIETRVGHAFIKEAMREHGAVFAGELSGHYYFREASCAEEPWLAVLRVLEELAGSGRPLSALVAELERYPRTGELNFAVEDKQAALARLAESFADAELSRLDGLTIRYPTWWANVRPSNTEPLLRLNLEADDAETLAQARERLLAAIGSEPEA
ncbi:MAG: phosphomannomutase/phosphoglucomutase [Planctomycetota bacterium]|nr:MAG: phosphomannomutase/phosphoglucomutase [Planctomycetota bacterium]